MKYGDLTLLFREAGCPTTPLDIGLSRDRVIDTFYAAGIIRNRYTILDLAWETGLLEVASEELRNSPHYLR